MASITFAHDQRPPVDQTLETIGDGAAVLTKPIRVRVQPDLYDWRKTTYTSWSGLSWLIEIEDVAEGRRLRQALTDFFNVFGASEKRQRQLLVALQKLAAGARG